MIKLTDELKAKLLAAKSAGDAVELLKAAGQEILPQDTAQLWEEIERLREFDSVTLNKEDLGPVSGGGRRPDFENMDCAAFFA